VFQSHVTPQALIAPARLAGVPLLRAQSDERLVDLVRAGNDAAFEAIVTRYRRPLLRYCTKFLSGTRAEDAVQTAFMNALSSLRSSDNQINLRPWLYRIAHNAALNGLRDRGLAHEQLSEEIDGVERPDQAFEKKERLTEVVAAVGALPERQRDAVVLQALEGRPYDEIAAELGVSDGSVRQLLNRARNTLRSGMTAVTPIALLARFPFGAGTGESMGARVAEICAGGAGAAVLTKVCATAVVTGAVVGGVAGSPSGGIDDGRAGDNRRAAPREATRDSVREASSLPVAPAVPAEEPRAKDRGGEGRRGEGERDDSGPGDNSGPGDGDREERRREGDDRSGSDSGRSASSGSGSSGSGSSGSGSGSDDSGAQDSSGPGSGGSQIEEPDSGSSGSGSSLEDSGSSGSGSSGSSGSGSGGSGSGGDED
jgi:RNA polymerase sigma factor (sigma-70 family)